MVQHFFFWIAFLACVIGQMGMLCKVLGNTKSNVILAVSNVILSAAVAANILAVIGVYNIWTVASILLIEGIIFCILFHESLRKKNINPDISNDSVKQWFCIGIVLLLIFLIYSYFIIVPFGIGRDPSVYLYNGVHIAETGSIHFESDSYLNLNYVDLKELVDLNGAGLYSAYDWGISDMPGDVIIQFLHMYPSILAIGYSLGGLTGELLINPIIAVLCAAMIYVYTKDILGNPKAAWIALLLCALNPAQIYSARITQSELLCQLFFLMSVYYFAKGWTSNNRWLIAFSGSLIGLMTFIRIDMYILGGGVLVIALYHIWFQRQNAKRILLYSACYVFVGSAALLYGYIYLFPYYKDHWDQGVLSAILIVNIVLIIIVLLSFFVRNGFLKKREIPDFVAYFSDNKNALLIFLTVLTSVVLLVYYVRPLTAIQNGVVNEAERFKANSLVELCFYTSFPALLFAIYGIYILIRRVPVDTIFTYLPWAFMGMSNLLIYIYSPSIASDQIWASRRWVTICIPMVLMLAAVGLSRVNLKKIKNSTMFIQIPICGILIFYLLFQGKGFLGRDIGGEIWKEYQQYAQILESEQLYFSENKMLVTILRELWGKKNVYRANEEFSTNIAPYLQNNEAVYFIGDVPSEIKYNPEIRTQKVAEYSLYSNELERAYGRMPTEIVDVTISADIFKLENKVNKAVVKSIFEPDKSVPFKYTLSNFGSNNRELKSKIFRSNGAPGYILYGPYETLENGTYEVTVEFSVIEEILPLQEPIAYFEVVGPNQKVINQKQIYNNGESKVSILFSVNELMSSIEYRFYTHAGTIVEILGVQLTQLSDGFAPGFDDWNSMMDIRKMLSEYSLEEKQIAYYYEGDYEKIFTEPLETENGRTEGWRNFVSSDSKIDYDVLISDVKSMEWLPLLDEYDIACRKGNYFVFVRKGSFYSVMANEQLSIEGYVDLSTLYKAEGDSYTIGQYESIPAGGYEIKFVLPEELLADFADIYIKQNDEVIATTTLRKGETEATIACDFRKMISDLSVEILTSDFESINDFTILIKQEKTGEELFWQEYIKPLLDKMKDQINENKIVVLDSSSDTKEILDLALNNNRQFLIEVCDSDNMEVIEESIKNKCVIVRKGAIQEKMLLERKYSVVAVTDLYALFVPEKLKSHFDNNHFLSEGDCLLTQYYQRSDERTISLNQGTYELVAHLKLSEAATIDILSRGKIKVVNGKNVIAEYSIYNVAQEKSNLKEIELYIPLYLEQSMSDIRIKAELDTSAAGAMCWIEKIRYVDWRNIGLDEFSYTDGQITLDGIWVESDGTDIIYGPYYDILPGKYKVQWIYETGDDQGVVFEVTSDMGNKVLSQKRIEIASDIDGEQQQELLFEVNPEDQKIEFRVVIPQGKNILLKGVRLYQQ